MSALKRQSVIRIGRQRIVTAMAMVLIMNGVTKAANETVRRKPDATGRPNILVIVTDQQFAEALSCRMGRQHIHTPAMDSLAERGMFFSRAYCVFPLCGPSRNSMFTGLYPQQINRRPYSDNPSRYMGRYLLDAGYDTAYSGKSELFGRNEPDVYGFQTVGAVMSVETRRAALENGGWDVWTAQAALEFLARPRDKPFLLAVGFLNPHNICEWSRKLGGQEGELDCGEIGEPPPVGQLPPLPGNVAPQRNEPDGMTLMRRAYRASRYFPVGNYTPEDWRKHRWGYYRMVELVDKQIGRLLDALRDSGQEENTLVVFTADHGECAGAHGWNQKSVPYDEATRVPLIVSWKGRTRSGTSDKLVNTGIDILPTVLEAAGVAVPKEMPGRSLLPLALGKPTAAWRDEVISQMSMSQGGEIEGLTPKMKWWMVRTERYKYCLFSNGERCESLVDMQADPGETVNLAAEPEHCTVLLEHRQRLSRYGKEQNDKGIAALLPGGGAE